MNRCTTLIMCAWLMAGCDSPAKKDGVTVKPEASASAARLPAAGAGSASAAAATPSPSASASTAVAVSEFVREHSGDPGGKGVDACIYLGFLTHNCINAYVDENDPVVKRYMKHIASAQAVLDGVLLRKGEPMFGSTAGFPPCPPDGSPCGGLEMGCLLSANVATPGPETKAAHAAICKCKSAMVELPVMGGTLACDGTKPVDLSSSMPEGVAKQVRQCAECDAADGPAACADEVKRFETADKELAAYLEKTHVPRCRKP